MEAIQKTNGAIQMHEGNGAFTPERVALIRRTICPKGITDDELALFVEQCRRSELDPLLKQAYCVPRKLNIGTKDNPKWIERHEFQASESGIMARAERFPDFRGVTSAAVHERDEKSIDAGEGSVIHKFSPTNRGPLLGAWARIRRENRDPVVVWLDLAGYSQNTHFWSRIPDTMIAKCARAAVLRMAYPSAFGGLYIEEEMPADELVGGPVDVVGLKTTNESIKEKLLAKTVREPEPKATLILDVPAGKTEAEAISEAKTKKTPITPSANPAWATMLSLGAQYGKTGADLKKFVKGVTNKTKPSDITQDDVSQVHDALVVLTAVLPAKLLADPAPNEDAPF